MLNCTLLPESYLIQKCAKSFTDNKCRFTNLFSLHKSVACVIFIVIICANFWCLLIERVRRSGDGAVQNLFGISHWNGWTSVEQCCATAQPALCRQCHVLNHYVYIVVVVVQYLPPDEALAARRIALQRSRSWVDPAALLIVNPVHSTMSSVQRLRCRPRLLFPGVHPWINSSSRLSYFRVVCP